MKETLELEVFEYSSWNKVENTKFLNLNEDEKLTDLFTGSLCKVDYGYSFLNNFLQLSNKSRNVLFIITSYSYMINRTFVLNGRFYTIKAKIVFDEFDIDKLK